MEPHIPKSCLVNSSSQSQLRHQLLCEAFPASPPPSNWAFCASFCSCTGGSQGQQFVEGSVCPIPMPEGPSGSQRFTYVFQCAGLISGGALWTCAERMNEQPAMDGSPPGPSGGRRLSSCHWVCPAPQVPQSLPQGWEGGLFVPDLQPQGE